MIRFVLITIFAAASASTCFVQNAEPPDEISDEAAQLTPAEQQHVLDEMARLQGRWKVVELRHQEHKETPAEYTLEFQLIDDRMLVISRCQGHVSTVRTLVSLRGLVSSVVDFHALRRTYLLNGVYQFESPTRLILNQSLIGFPKSIDESGLPYIRMTLEKIPADPSAPAPAKEVVTGRDIQAVDHPFGHPIFTEAIRTDEMATRSVLQLPLQERGDAFLKYYGIDKRRAGTVMRLSPYPIVLLVDPDTRQSEVVKQIVTALEESQIALESQMTLVDASRIWVTLSLSQNDSAQKVIPVIGGLKEIGVERITLRCGETRRTEIILSVPSDFPSEESNRLSEGLSRVSDKFSLEGFDFESKLRDSETSAGKVPTSAGPDISANTGVIPALDDQSESSAAKQAIVLIIDPEAKQSEVVKQVVEALEKAGIGRAQTEQSATNAETGDLSVVLLARRDVAYQDLMKLVGLLKSTGVRQLKFRVTESEENLVEIRSGANTPHDAVQRVVEGLKTFQDGGQSPMEFSLKVSQSFHEAGTEAPIEESLSSTRDKKQQSVPPAAELDSTPPEQVGMQSRESNQEIATSVADALSKVKLSDLQGVQILVKDGVCTITGRMKTAADIELAGKVASIVPGVTSVQNQLIAKDPQLNSEKNEIKVFALQHAQATDAAEIVKQVYDKGRSKIVPDARTNSVIVTGPEAQVQEIEALLLKLDEVGKAEPGKLVVSSNGNSTEQVIDSNIDLRMQVTQLRSYYEAANKQARDLAESNPRTTDAPKKAELRTAVQRAFTLRQSLLRVELLEMQTRLLQTQQSLDMRERIADQIVDRRVEDLLNPQLEWEQRENGDATPPIESRSKTSVNVGADGSLNQPSEAGGARTVGGDGSTSFMNISGAGRTVTYVIDTSASMNGKRLKLAQSQLKSSLRLLRPDQKFSIILYNEGTVRLKPGDQAEEDFYPASDLNIQLVQSEMDRIHPSLGTSHMPALLEALHAKPDVIYFLTDGDEPELSDIDFGEIARRRGKTTIHVIEFADGTLKRAANWLERLARQSNGEYRLLEITDEDRGNVVQRGDVKRPNSIPKATEEQSSRWRSGIVDIYWEYNSPTDGTHQDPVGKGVAISPKGLVICQVPEEIQQKNDSTTKFIVRFDDGGFAYTTVVEEADHGWLALQPTQSSNHQFPIATSPMNVGDQVHLWACDSSSPPRRVTVDLAKVMLLDRDTTKANTPVCQLTRPIDFRAESCPVLSGDGELLGITLRDTGDLVLAVPVSQLKTMFPKSFGQLVADKSLDPEIHSVAEIDERLRDLQGVWQLEEKIDNSLVVVEIRENVMTWSLDPPQPDNDKPPVFLMKLGKPGTPHPVDLVMNPNDGKDLTEIPGIIEIRDDVVRICVSFDGEVNSKGDGERARPEVFADGKAATLWTLRRPMKQSPLSPGGQLAPAPEGNPLEPVVPTNVTVNFRPQHDEQFSVGEIVDVEANYMNRSGKLVTVKLLACLVVSAIHVDAASSRMTDIELTANDMQAQLLQGMMKQAAEYLKLVKHSPNDHAFIDSNGFNSAACTAFIVDAVPNSALLAKLQGRWDMRMIEADPNPPGGKGEAVVDGDLMTITITLDGKSVTIPVQLKLDGSPELHEASMDGKRILLRRPEKSRPAGSPPPIDLIHWPNDEQERTVLPGIIEFRDDSVRICLGNSAQSKRPEVFAVGENANIWELRRKPAVTELEGDWHLVTDYDHEGKQRETSPSNWTFRGDQRSNVWPGGGYVCRIKVNPVEKTLWSYSKEDDGSFGQDYYELKGNQLILRDKPDAVGYQVLERGHVRIPSVVPPATLEQKLLWRSAIVEIVVSTVNSQALRERVIGRGIVISSDGKMLSQLAVNESGDLSKEKIKAKFDDGSVIPLKLIEEAGQGWAVLQPEQPIDVNHFFEVSTTEVQLHDEVRVWIPDHSQAGSESLAPFANTVSALDRKYPALGIAVWQLRIGHRPVLGTPILDAEGNLLGITITGTRDLLLAVPVAQLKTMFPDSFGQQSNDEPQPAKELPDWLTDLQGKWTVTDSPISVFEDTGGQMKEIRIDRDQWAIVWTAKPGDPDRVESLRVLRPDEKNLSAIDLVDPSTSKVVYPSLYELNQTGLTFCYGHLGTRPKEIGNIVTIKLTREPILVTP